LEVFLWSFA